MAKKPKKITPFFNLRHQINDTLEALSGELLMTMQTIDTVLKLSGMNNTAKELLSERLDALKAVCLVDEPKS